MSAHQVYLLLTGLTFLICLMAILRGGPGERMAGLLILGVVALGRGMIAITPPQAYPLISLSSDALTAIGLLILTVRYASFWLGSVMMFYAAQFALHSVYFVTDRPHDVFHSLANNINFAGIHLCLLTGTLISWRRAVLRAKAYNAALDAELKPDGSGSDRSER
jgi:hypothetical protein